MSTMATPQGVLIKSYKITWVRTQYVRDKKIGGPENIESQLRNGDQNSWPTFLSLAGLSIHSVPCYCISSRVQTVFRRENFSPNAQRRYLPDKTVYDVNNFSLPSDGQSPASGCHTQKCTQIIPFCAASIFSLVFPQLSKMLELKAHHMCKWF